MDYLEKWASRSGINLGLRRITPPDAQKLRAFVAEISPTSRYQRFHCDRRTLSQTDASYLADVDFRMHHAFIVCAFYGGREVLVAEARCAALSVNRQCAEYAIAVADPWQRQGIGRRCLERLIDVASQSGYQQLTGDVLPSNHAMLTLARKLGFECTSTGRQVAVTRISLGNDALAAVPVPQIPD